FTREDYIEFADDLAKSGYSSVDAFLENKQEWLDVGKAAIALQMLRAESECKHRLFPPKQPSDHWYETLWTHLSAPSWRGFKSNPISIVTFNYDRSLEHYLVTVACNRYGIRPHTALRGITQFPILHVHGDLGPYLDTKKNPYWEIPLEGGLSTLQ
ncbi:MAG: hypothetical protein V2J25_14820, partial [Desulfatiglans sp.]|nr:hypothetical protein [Desulfatiglans sp.]